MGATYVAVTIRNPADLDRCWEGLFRVDTGATDSLMPGPHLDAIGLKPEGTRVYELADGNEIVMDITIANIEFMGEIVGGTILYGASDAQPLLGLTALASVGIEVDPVSQRLKRRPAVRLQRLGNCANVRTLFLPGISSWLARAAWFPAITVFRRSGSSRKNSPNDLACTASPSRQKSPAWTGTSPSGMLISFCRPWLSPRRTRRTSESPPARASAEVSTAPTR